MINGMHTICCFGLCRLCCLCCLCCFNGQHNCKSFTMIRGYGSMNCINGINGINGIISKTRREHKQHKQHKRHGQHGQHKPHKWHKRQKRRKQHPLKCHALACPVCELRLNPSPPSFTIYRALACPALARVSLIVLASGSLIRVRGEGPG